MDHVDKKFLKRRVVRVRLKDILDEEKCKVREDAVAPYRKDGVFFLKTEHKKCSGLVDEKSIYSYESILFNIHSHFTGEVDLIISEPINILPAKEFAEMHPRWSIVVGLQMAG